MTRAASKYPTERELMILKVLWREGPLPVRGVLEAMDDAEERAYTSVMTLMNIMANKGYLKRVKDKNSYIYHPVLTKEAATNNMMGDLVERLFEGSTTAAALQLLETADIDEAELERLRALIARKTEGKQS